jgi:hypothetical protein
LRAWASVRKIWIILKQVTSTSLSLPIINLNLTVPLYIVFITQPIYHTKRKCTRLCEHTMKTWLSPLSRLRPAYMRVTYNTYTLTWTVRFDELLFDWIWNYLFHLSLCSCLSEFYKPIDGWSKTNNAWRDKILSKNNWFDKNKIFQSRNSVRYRNLQLLYQSILIFSQYFDTGHFFKRMKT